MGVRVKDAGESERRVVMIRIRVACGIVRKRNRIYPVTEFETERLNNITRHESEQTSGRCFIAK